MPLDMNPLVRARWCAALRSGDYTQATGALKRGLTNAGHPGYCCLGVLTDLWLKAGHDEMIPDADSDGLPTAVSVWDDVEGSLSRPVAEWAGLSECDPLLQPGDDHWADGYAANLNDEGCTFAEIADLIDGGAS